MVVVEPRKTVKITAEPLSQDESSIKLGEYFRSELQKKSNIRKGDYDCYV